MLPEVYISVFAGYMYDIGTHAAKRRKPGESDTFRAIVQHIKSPAKKIYCSSKNRRRIGQMTIITRLQRRNKETNKKYWRLTPP